MEYQVCEGTYALRRDRDGRYYKGTLTKRGAVGVETNDYIFTPNVGRADLFYSSGVDGHTQMAQSVEIESRESSKPSTFTVVDVSGFVFE
jgi:hypothetical protein